MKKDNSNNIVTGGGAGGGVSSTSNLTTTKPVVKNLAEGEVVPMDEKPKSELVKGVLKKNG